MTLQTGLVKASPKMKVTLLSSGGCSSPTVRSVQ